MKGKFLFKKKPVLGFKKKYALISLTSKKKIINLMIDVI